MMFSNVKGITFENIMVEKDEISILSNGIEINQMKSYQRPEESYRKVKLECSDQIDKRFIDSGIYIRMIRYRVEPFKKSLVIQCYKCQMLGHMSFNCKETNRTCIQFGKKEHAMDQNGKCTDPVKKCVLCNGAHSSASRECEVKIKK